jgi:hypothetical protein
VGTFPFDITEVEMLPTGAKVFPKGEMKSFGIMGMDRLHKGMILGIAH